MLNKLQRERLKSQVKKLIQTTENIEMEDAMIVLSELCMDNSYSLMGKRLNILDESDEEHDYRVLEKIISDYRPTQPLKRVFKKTSYTTPIQAQNSARRQAEMTIRELERIDQTRITARQLETLYKLKYPTQYKYYVGVQYANNKLENVLLVNAPDPYKAKLIWAKLTGWYSTITIPASWDTSARWSYIGNTIVAVPVTN